MTITVPYHQLRALFAAVAGKDEQRSYIKNLRVDFSQALLHNKVTLVATNGAQMTWAEVKVTLFDDTPVLEAGVNYAPVRLPARLDAAQALVGIDTDADQLSYTSRGQQKTIDLIRVPDIGKTPDNGATAYPDWRRIAFADRYVGQLHQIGIDPMILAPMASALGAMAKLSFGATDQASIRVDWIGKNVEDIKTLLMPVKL
jgi:hypothetical protein